MSRYVDLDERVTAQFYDQECEEWTMQTVTIADVLDSVCDEYTVLPSAQPQDIAQDIATIIENEKDMRVISKNAQSDIILCKDCKYWRRQTNYAGAPLSFGFCESDDMWRSLYGETYEVSHIDTDDDFYCGYAERREE